MDHRVLIASENVEFLQTCKQLDNDFSVVTAKTGSEALTALKMEDCWSVIVSDFNLSDMEGTQLLNRCAMKTITPTSTILLARYREIEVGVNAVNSNNFFTLLPIPCSLQMLNAVLRDAVRNSYIMGQQILLHEKVKALTIIDPLTKCYTRNYLLDRLPHELRRAHRYHHDLSIILCDIDQLQTINETYSYRIGNIVLSRYAELIQKKIRTDLDWVTRWGGDELLIVLPETPINGAKIVAQRLLDLFTTMEIQTKSGSFKMTASFGVTGLSSERLRMEEILSKAENCLNQAQSAGGNQVIANDHKVISIDVV